MALVAVPVLAVVQVSEAALVLELALESELAWGWDLACLKKELPTILRTLPARIATGQQNHHTQRGQAGPHEMRYSLIPTTWMRNRRLGVFRCVP